MITIYNGMLHDMNNLRSSTDNDIKNYVNTIDQELPTIGITKNKSIAFFQQCINNPTLSVAFSTYQDIKNNNLFKILYPLMNVEFYKKDNSKVTMHALACHVCEIYFPVTSIQIDHQAPKSIGGIEAILKVFRVYGLTMNIAKGRKNRQLSLSFFSNTKNIPFSMQPLPAKTAVSDPNKKLRYTLNTAGVIHFNNILSDMNLNFLTKLCLSHIANLRPTCASCNGKDKSDEVKLKHNESHYRTLYPTKWYK